MQTTLLGLAIAFILALVAALIGPHFIDWNQFRPRFEAEATRLIGAPVRVAGALDARILPTPTLRLRDITVGDQSTTRRMSAEKLDVELSLGSLLRGEWRASELSLDGFALDFDLDRQGRVQGPVPSGAFSLGSLAIDRLNLAGRMTLHDVAGGRSFELNELKFGGDIRALAGAMRGEGSFVLNDERSSFRISTGQSADGRGTRLRLILDRSSHAAVADLDGVVIFESQAPKFDGALTLASAADPKSSKEFQDAASFPWRIVSRVQASSSSATFDQIEVVYGPEEIAMRLAGAGKMTLGATPSLRVKLSARQLDADRLRAKKTLDEKSRSLISELQKALSLLPQPQIPMNIEMTAEQIVLGGRPLQNIALQISADESRWMLDKLSLRAPGATEIAISGSMSSGRAAPEFSGPVAVESAEPEVFLAWLQGRNDSTQFNRSAMRVRGHALLNSQRMAFDALEVQTGGGAIKGDVSFQNRDGSIGRLDAKLKADDFNIDALGDLDGSILSLSKFPSEANVSLDIERPSFQGRAIRPIAVSVFYGPNEFIVDRFAIGEVDGISLSGSGSLNLKANDGHFSMMATASSIEKIGAFVAPYMPDFAGRLKSIDASKQGAVRLVLNAKIEKISKLEQAEVRATVDIDADAIKGNAIISIVPRSAVKTWSDVEALSRSDFKVETVLSSDGAASLLKLAGLERVFSAPDGPTKFESSVAGAWREPLTLIASLQGREVVAAVKGTVDPWSTEAKADLKISVDRADISPLLNLKAGSVQSIKASSRLDIAGDRYKFESVEAAIGNSTMRGQFVATRSEINGEANFDTIDASSVAALAIGAVGKESAAPLNQTITNGLRGSISIRAAKAQLPRMASLDGFSATVRSDGQNLMLEGGTGHIARGEANFTGDVRKSLDGTSINLNIKVANADVAAIRPLNFSLPEAKASLQVSLASRGLSADALMGAMSGAGTMTFNDLRVLGFSPGAFEDAVSATDDGRQLDEASLKAIVETALQKSVTEITSAQVPFTIREGRLRVARATAETRGASVLVSGGYDFAADQMDMRASLIANVVNAATGRPEIRIDLNGAPDRFVRTIDISSLSSWLAMRSIDRQTRKLDQLERGVTPGLEPLAETMSLQEDLPKVDPLPASQIKLPVRDPRRRATSSQTNARQPTSAREASSDLIAPTVQPLPPAINVAPAPGTAKPPKPRPPMVLTPPTSGTTIF